jgi:isocitrate/isopropylmalate dehydrogenase
MARYRIALMPGDGIGKDVMDAAQIVLDKIDVDAEYIPAEAEGKVRTYDMGGEAGTLDMAQTIANRL